VSREEGSIFWEVTISVILRKEIYKYMCPIPNGFRDRAVSLHSSKIVDKRKILRTVSNTGIYCSSDKVGAVYISTCVLFRTVSEIESFHSTVPKLLIRER
jgi:hypothetical protein